MLTQQTIDFNKKYWEAYLKEEFETKGIDKKVSIKFHDDDTFYIDTKDSENKSSGLVRIGISIVPGDAAKTNPVGLGRGPPN
jgi:hypothetical protein